MIKISTSLKNTVQDLRSISMESWWTCKFYLNNRQVVLLQQQPKNDRSRRSRMLYKLVVFKNFEKFLVAHLCWNLYLDAGL